MLYFFHEERAIISHGCLKNDKRKFEKEIDITIRCRKNYIINPDKHTYRE